MIRLCICIFGSIIQVHNCIPLSIEQCCLQRFGEVGTVNFLCGAVFNADLLLFNAVSDEKIPYVNVTGFISKQILTAPLHKDGALVTLVHDILVYLEKLAL